MAYSPIEESYMNGYVSTQFETPPEPVLLAQNTGARPTQQPWTETDGGASIGYRLNMPKGLNTPENMRKVGGEILPAGAAIAKGAGQASVGMYGDIEGLGRMVLNYMGVDVNEKTKLPTTEEVKGFLDKYIPVDEKYATFEKAGELASPAGAYGLGKAGVKAVKSTKGLPVGNSIKIMDGTEITLPKAPKIESKAFKNWFGESKAVDDTGTPIVVYHARRGDFESFDPLKSEGKSAGTGTFFSSSPDVAATYNTSSEHNIVPAYLSLKKPFIVDFNGSNWNQGGAEALVKLPDGTDDDLLSYFGAAMDETVSTDDVARLAREQGYDGVIIRNVVDHGPAGRFASKEAEKPGDIYIAFQPEQIKSVMNKGTFDPKDPRMLYGGASVTVSGEPENKENK